MALHAALMAQVDAQLQRVVAGRASVGACEAHVPRFQGRGVDGGRPDTCLEEHGVDARHLQLVERLDEFLFLFAGLLRARPVDATDGGQPDGPHFVLGRLGAEGWREEYVE